MKNISLLPPEIKLRQKSRQKRMMLATVAFAVAVVFACSYLLIYISISNANDRLYAVREQRKTLESEMLSLDEYSLLQKRATKVEKAFDEVMKKTPDWEMVLKDLSSSVPNGVWLTAIDAKLAGKDNKTGDSGTLTVKGWSGSNAGLNQWLPEVRSIEGLEAVKCDHFSNKEYQGVSAFQFELKAGVKPGKFTLVQEKE